MDSISAADDSFCRTTFDLGDNNISKIRVPVLIIAGDNDGLDKTELSKPINYWEVMSFADMGEMPKSPIGYCSGTNPCESDDADSNDSELSE